MKCQITFSWKNKKNTINLLVTEFVQRVVMVEFICSSDENWLPIFRGFSGIGSKNRFATTDMFRAWVYGIYTTSDPVCSTSDVMSCSRYYRRSGLFSEWHTLDRGKVITLNKSTVEFQWLEHLCDYGHLFETWVFRAIEG